MQHSFATIGRAYYSENEVAAALRNLAKVDPGLLDDGTLFVASEDQQLVGCGGWTTRAGQLGDLSAQDVALSTARAKSTGVIRSFFVEPSYAGKGIAKKLFTLCVEDARSRGCHSLEVLAAMSSKDMFIHLGFGDSVKRVLSTPEGADLVSYHMKMKI